MNTVQYDLYRLTGRTDVCTFVKTFLRDKSFRYIVYLRIRQEGRKTSLSYLFARVAWFFLFRKMTIEIPPTAKIGKGLLLIHPYCITFNSQAEVGDNFTIMKGATIGNIKSGKRSGSPIIGNNVYVGLNSTVVGGGKNW